MDDSHWREEFDRMRAKLAEEGKRFDAREKRCERNCMGYPAKDVRHWVAAEALTAAQARVEELERMVVWCVQHEAEISFVDKDSWMIASYSEPSFPLTCTPDSILAAVAKAMKEE